MDTLFQDLRYPLRQFARRPGFTAVAVLSLGLAIGGNSLIYGMLDGFVFRPFPYPEPDRLAAVGVASPKLSAETTYVEALSPAEYFDIRTNRSDSRDRTTPRARSVRLAVGAQRRDVVWLVLGQVLRLSVVGLAIGVLVLIFAGRALEGLLFGVRSADPVTIAAVTAVLGAVALLAAWAPALRASKADPIEALRYE